MARPLQRRVAMHDGTNGAATDLAAAVTTIFRAHTLYSPEQLKLDSQLEGELGIDSVLLDSIFAEIRATFSLPRTALKRSGLSTLGDVLAAVDAAVRGAAPPPIIVAAPPPIVVAAPPPPPLTPPPAAPLSTAAGLTERLRAAIAEATGRTADGVADDESFVVAGLSPALRDRIVGELAAELALPPVLRLEECDTVAKLARYLGAAAPHAVAPLPQASAPVEAGAIDDDPRTMKDFAEQRDPDLFAKARSFGAFYREKQRQQLYWYGMALETPCRNRIVVYDELVGRRRELLMFASNNYLGLANHPHVVDAIADATRRFGSTNTGCRLIGGTNTLHKELERRLARFKGTEACLIYPSGYSANLGAISALVKRHDAVIVDKLNHMSIVDGCKLSGGQRKIYAHEDMQDLERVLASCEGQVDGKLIAVDGVFSMHGNICNLPEIVRLARKYGARVLVDDAHATGVLGRRGSGTAEHFGLRGGVDVDLELGTMSKTLAGIGGFVCGNHDVVEYLRFYSSSYVFAANIPAGVAAGLIASIDVIEREPERITKLWENIHHLKGQLEAAGLDTGGANSAIIPVVIGDDRLTLEMGRRVRARGMFCQTVVFPGVSVGDARLRISVTSEHTREDLDRAADIVVSSARELGLTERSR